MNKTTYISTMGSNLFDILCKEYVDSNRTISNDVNEIYETFELKRKIYN